MGRPLRSVAIRWLVGVMCVLLWGPVAWGGRVLNDMLVTRPFNHRIWDKVVSENVSQSGAVDYSALKASPKRLNQYLSQLASASPLSTPEAFPNKAHRAAYWINAYNALALRLLLDRYPVDGLQQLGDFRTSTRYQLGRKPTSLRDIETQLSQQMPGWPAVFLALTDTSQSAPRLLNQAYRPEQLKEQLADQARWLVGEGGLVTVSPGGCGPMHLPASFQRLPLAPATLSDTLFPALSPDQQGALAGACQGQPLPVEFDPADWRLRRLP
jgi:hypothetical protein